MLKKWNPLAAMPCDIQKGEDELKTAYASRERCIADIFLARETMKSVSTSRSTYNEMETLLAFMYLYCPEDLCGTVETVVREASQRRLFFERRWKLKETPANNLTGVR